MEENRKIGIVKWFNAVKGYGFIALEGFDGDIFVHHTSIQTSGFRKLRAKQIVEFSVVSSDKGPQAQNVSLIQEER